MNTKTTIVTIMLAFIGLSSSFAQVGIGTKTPHPSSILDLTATDKGFLPPRMDTAQRNALPSPATGLVVYNTTTKRLEFSDGTNWITLTDGSVITAINSTANTGTGGAGIGTKTPAPSSILDLTATDKGFLPPRLTTTERDDITSPAEGLTIYNTDNNCIEFWNATVWISACDGSVVTIGTIASIDCAGATNNGTLTGGVAASGVNSIISYTGGNGGTHSGQTVASTGVTGLTATLTAGTFVSGAGTLTYTITGTPSIAGGTASFAINIGGQNCTLQRTVAPPVGTIASINCADATNNGTLTSCVDASGVSSVVPYTGGNGGTHSGQVVSSTGVTGLTATIAAGSFAVGSGNLTVTITGTPSGAGTASFALNIGGQTCTLTRTVVVIICTNSTAIVDVVSATGRTWMDRNLGATRAATSSTDAQSYGYLYQWGRASDGHQCVNRYAGDGVTTSCTTTTLATTDQPANANFILTPTTPFDWRSDNNTNRWNTSPQVNNPCPTGYRVPTEAQLNAERAIFPTQNAAGAFNSVLKLPMAGGRYYGDGGVGSVGNNGGYWSSTVSSTNSRRLNINSSFALMFSNTRANGFSVRCIKD